VHVTFVGRNLPSAMAKWVSLSVIMDSKILDELQEGCSQELSLVGEDLGALEAAVKAKMQQLGQGLLQRLVQRKPNGYRGSSLACECAGSKRFVGHRRRQVHGIFGWIEIRRAYYHCPMCHRGEVPYDQGSGLGPEQTSPGLASYCCTLTVDDSFEETSRKVEELLGQEVSANTIERLTQHVGRVLLEGSDQELADFQADRWKSVRKRDPDRE